MEVGSLRATFSKLSIQVLLLCGVVLLVYYPTIFAEVSLLDDYSMLMNLQNSAGFSLHDVFVPHSHQGGYYRPLIGLSFEFDKVAWDLAPVIMHFENILLHLGIVLLVLWFGRMLFGKRENGAFVSFGIALLFSLHPIATESVNWISGRTDLLAGFFMFLGICFYLCADKHDSLIGKIGAVLVMILGGLAKETAFSSFVVLPVMISGIRSGSLTPVVAHARKVLLLFTVCCGFIVALTIATYNYWFAIGGIFAWFFYVWGNSSHENNHNSIAAYKNIATLCLLSTVAVAMFWGLRRLAYSSDISKIGQTIKLMFSDLNYTIHLFIGAIAFYVKKFIFPFPLNLAIREIDPVYSLFGILIILAIIILIVNKSLFSSLVLSGVFFLVPVLPFAFGTIAWTAYAERYVYLAAPFWMLSLGSVALETNIIAKPLTKPLLGMLVLLTIYATFQRNLVWQTNISIFADTISKSPQFRIVRGLYMQALYRENRYDEAIDQYKIASKLPAVGYEDTLDLLYANILEQRGRRDDAYDVYRSVWKKSHAKSIGALRGLLGHYEYLISDGSKAERDGVRKIEEYAKKIADMSKDPNDYYKLGKIYDRYHNYDAAAQAFKVALSHKGVDASVTSAIHTMMSRYRSL